MGVKFASSPAHGLTTGAGWGIIDGEAVPQSMITGFNTDVQFNGKVYHVQTEDRGDENPIIESLVYMQGEILDSVRTPYSDLDEKALTSVLEDQHKRVLRNIKNGRYDPDGIKPLGHGIISDRSFDEVVLQFLQEQQAAEKVELQVEELGDLAPGWTGALRISLRTDILNRPVAGEVRITLEPPDSGKPVVLFKGKTDDMGTVLAEVTLPDTPARGEIHILARTEDGEHETRLPVKAAR